MRKPKFPVTLEDDEREELEKITRQQTAKSKHTNGQHKVSLGMV